ncbi:TonB-dependent receptor [Stutzerimonas stutzeri]|uniref:TonB-dependent receptor n=3 Tax=Stutzerimonas stutzeri TaxID=316 RepID=A0A2N8RI06_STUST|nr:TonB-dependent receptor [Stutzerimonas stutzeri]MCQ4253035.1 TonB-dependent receptor [Stutzerimonas stutzeri]MDH2244308.1 TonB-dependent receptor [Pseudomonas sp. GD03909]PNF60737.1 TonB-dependent receptor [Stutzerimonas stutzeri]QOZ94080.1 TonB-dependent receptor [Stutzerimonas stutzeri]
MFRKTCLCLSISLASLSLSSSPVAAANEAAELEAVTISATRARSEAGKTPQKITVIDREQIEQQLAITGDHGAILSNLIPSYSPSRQKMSSAGETFRGRSALILIDGVPQSTPLRDSQRDGYVIDLSMVERIEVIHGASAEHGLGATGGIINYVTRRPASGALRQHAGISFTAPTRYESEGLGYKLDYRIEGTQGDFDYLAAASWQTQGMFYDANGDLIGVDDTQGDVMDSTSTDLMLKLGYWLDDDQNIGLMVNRYQVEGEHEYVNVPGDADAEIPATSRKGSPLGKAPQNEVLATSLSYKHADLYGNELGLQLYTQRFRGRFGGGTNATFQDPSIAPVGTLFDQSQNESDKIGGKLTISRDGLLDNHLMLTGGIDVLQDTTSQQLILTDREWVPETVFLNYAPFLQAEIRVLEQLTLHAGVRHEFADLEIDSFRTIASTKPVGSVAVEGGNPTFEETLYNAGLVWQMNDWAQLFANYSEGFGMPDVGRVLRGIGTPGTRVDDFLDLQPVVTENREIGFRLNHGPFDAEISYYQSDADLGSRLDGVGGVYQVRRERTEIDGIEFAGGWQVNKAHRLKLVYAQVNGQSDTNGDGKVDTDLDGANISPDRYGISWQANWGEKLHSLLQANHYASRSFDTEGLDFDGYTLVDASLRYSLPLGEASLGIENLFNEDYLTYYSQAANTGTQETRNGRVFNGRGRTFTLGYQASF